jgi:adenylate cyclase
MGDGILEIFEAGSTGNPCCAALDVPATAAPTLTVGAWGGLPVTRFYLGLHVGEVLYSSIGSVDQLDFTVFGPAVNETNRIPATCRSLQRDLLTSSASPRRPDLPSLAWCPWAGTWVSRPQELFTLDFEGAAQNTGLRRWREARPPRGRPSRWSRAAAAGSRRSR